VYRIHEKNSLKIRKARYGGQVDTGGVRGKWVAGAAAAASVALWASPNVDPAKAVLAPLPPPEPQRVTQTDAPARPAAPSKSVPIEKKSAKPGQGPAAPDLMPPHS